MKPHQAAGHSPRERSPDGGRDEAITLLLTMADTTWRIFTPVLLFTGVGIWLDLSLGTKPWLTFTGVVIGFGIAALLIRTQLKKVRK